LKDELTSCSNPGPATMKLHGLTPVVPLISSAESAEALTLLRSLSYGGSVRRIHPWPYGRGLLRRRMKKGGLRDPFFYQWKSHPAGAEAAKSFKKFTLNWLDETPALGLPRGFL